jgi:hypothetical protein
MRGAAPLAEGAAQMELWRKWIFQYTPLKIKEKWFFTDTQLRNLGYMIYKGIMKPYSTFHGSHY